jgi:hypothetical protein
LAGKCHVTTRTNFQFFYSLKCIIYVLAVFVFEVSKEVVRHQLGKRGI